MRQILVDHARKRRTAKRGDRQRPITLDEAEYRSIGFVLGDSVI